MFHLNKKGIIFLNEKEVNSFGLTFGLTLALTNYSKKNIV